MAGRSPDLPEQNDATEIPSGDTLESERVPPDESTDGTDADDADKDTEEGEREPSGSLNGGARTAPDAEPSAVEPEAEPAPDPPTETGSDPEPRPELKPEPEQEPEPHPASASTGTFAGSETGSEDDSEEQANSATETSGLPGRVPARRITLWSPAVAALLVLVFLAVQLFRPLPAPRLVLSGISPSFTIGGSPFAVPWPAKGQAAVTLVGSGSMGTFGAQTPVPTASVAKIMTAYVVLRDHPLGKGDTGPQITIDAQAVRDGRSKDESRIQGLKVGDAFGEQDMLKMLMIPSGNNIARLLARWDTGSRNEAAFVRKMNAAARSLGMRNTTYTDPSGLERTTVSTAVDQLKLAVQVMRFDVFRSIVAMPEADIRGVGRISNNNRPLLTAGLGVSGIKTGSNTPAGGTLSWADYKTVDGKERLVLGTMMGQHATGPDPDGANSLVLVQDNCKRIVEAVRAVLTATTVVKKDQVVGYVDNGRRDRAPVVAAEDLKAIGVPGQKLGLRLVAGGTGLPRTAKAGTVVGELTVGSGPGAQKVPVVLEHGLAEPSFAQKVTRL